MIINLKIIVLLLIALASCQNKFTKSRPFVMEEASYQTWMETFRNKGTDVVITLTRVNSGVIFDSLVFRSAKVPVSYTFGNDTTIIKAIIPAKGSNSPVLPQYINEPDQLIYRLEDSRYVFYLKNIKRRNMNYLRK